MLVVSILDADNFGDELYEKMHNNLTSIIATEHVGVVVAAGNTKGMIYRLLSKMAVEYPDIFFTILLPNDKLAYDGSDAGYPHIFSLDPDICYDDPKNAKQRRRKMLIERSDIIFTRKNHCNDIREINKYCDILVV
jgi:hypothetical protein